MIMVQAMTRDRQSGGFGETDDLSRVRPAPEHEEKASTATIMIVDDDPIVRSVATHILEDAGYLVIAAEDGQMGVDIYGERGKDIDLVILDYVMPGMDGVETMREMLKLDPKVRVLTSSGHCAKEDVAAFVSMGARGFLPKPYTRDNFLSSVRRVLDSGLSEQ
jgi:two-component system, cell cycle sensor histidine kinase and response regulator CckA